MKEYAPGGGRGAEVGCRQEIKDKSWKEKREREKRRHPPLTLFQKFTSNPKTIADHPTPFYLPSLLPYLILPPSPIDKKRKKEERG